MELSPGHAPSRPQSSPRLSQALLCALLDCLPGWHMFLNSCLSEMSGVGMGEWVCRRNLCVVGTYNPWYKGNNTSLASSPPPPAYRPAYCWHLAPRRLPTRECGPQCSLLLISNFYLILFNIFILVVVFLESLQCCKHIIYKTEFKSLTAQSSARMLRSKFHWIQWDLCHRQVCIGFHINSSPLKKNQWN